MLILQLLETAADSSPTPASIATDNGLYAPVVPVLVRWRVLCFRTALGFPPVICNHIHLRLNVGTQYVQTN